MEAFWKSDPCYANYGVDGSRCSFIIYLSEVESYCPKFSWRPLVEKSNLKNDYVSLFFLHIKTLKHKKNGFVYCNRRSHGTMCKVCSI